MEIKHCPIYTTNRLTNITTNYLRKELSKCTLLRNTINEDAVFAWWLVNLNSYGFIQAKSLRLQYVE